jgi:hypothetical protein
MRDMVLNPEFSTINIILDGFNCKNILVFSLVLFIPFFSSLLLSKESPQKDKFDEKLASLRLSEGLTE